MRAHLSLGRRIWVQYDRAILLKLPDQLPTERHTTPSWWLVDHVDVLGGVTGDLRDYRCEGGGFSG